MVMKEPQLVTLPDLLDIQRELQQREPIFHQPKFAATRQQFDLMMDESFWEVGASGQRYSRQFVLDIVGSLGHDTDDDQWRCEGFNCRKIAPDNFLLTYTLHQGERVTRRATLWRRTPSGWKVLYHQ